MIIDNTERLVEYLNSVVDGLFKILPLYEEKNIGIEKYVESLLFKLASLDKMIDMKYSSDYVSLLLILKSLQDNAITLSGNKSIVKREVFKSINIVKNIIEGLEKDLEQ